MATAKKKPELIEGMDVMENTKASEETEAPQDDGTVVVKLMKDNYRYKDDVFISVNGRSIKIKRGVPVRIPKEHFEVLQNSMNQDAETAILISEAENDYKAAVSARIL